MKYLIVECRGCETPIIFPDWIEHSQVASAFPHVVSGGTVKFYGTGENWDTVVYSNRIEASCSGESISCKVKSRKDEDGALIEMVLQRDLN